MVHSILAESASLCPPISPICGIAAAIIVGSDIIVTHNNTHPRGYLGRKQQNIGVSWQAVDALPY